MSEKIHRRPKDKSLQAYKDWIMGMVKSLNPDAKETMTEEEWTERWKKFWAKSAAPKDGAESSDTTT